MVLAPMTVAIPSYQRRDPVMRLLRGLDKQLAANPEIARDLEVVVVLDGSTDGSKDAIEAHPWTVPVLVRCQAHQGRAAARNRGLETAAGRVVWFLDDDLEVSTDLVARHRQAHVDGSPTVVVGPCRIPNAADAPAGVVDWWDSFYADIERSGVIDRFDRFSAANTSGPAEVFSAVGGFDATFVEYGLEDYELAIRLLRAGVAIRFDAEAVAWHPDVPPISIRIGREYGVGLNATRMARLYPGMVDAFFPAERIVNSAAHRLLRRSRLRSPRALTAVSRLAVGVCRATARLGGSVSRRSELLAQVAAHAAGVAEGDPSGVLLDRVLGYSRETSSPR